MNKKKQKKKFAAEKSVHSASVKGTKTPVEEITNQQVNKHQAFMLIFMSLFVFILYSNTLNYPFHFDDEVTIVENINLRMTEISWQQIKNIYKDFLGLRPIPLATFAVNYYFGQYNTFGYHLFNIIIHIINGILIFFFVKKTIMMACDNGLTQFHDQEKQNIDILIPFFSSLIWMVHPLQTNSVTYIVQRMNSMATLFFLLTLLLYIQGRIIQIKNQVATMKTGGKKMTGSKNHYIFFLACLFTLLPAFGCKETSVTLPFFILLYEFYFFQDLNSSALKKSLIIFVILFFLMIIVIQVFISFQLIIGYFYMYYEGYSFTMSQRVLTELRVVIFYLSLLFFPHPNRLNFDHDFPLSDSLLNPYTTILSLFAIIGLISIALLKAKKEKFLSFGILWFFGNLVIESSIIPLDIIFEHRIYLPSIMVTTVFTVAAWRWLKSNRFRIGFLSALVILLSLWTFQRNSIWQDPITLWQDCVKKSPNKDRPHADLGRSYELAGRLDEAIEEYKKTLKINPLHQFTLRNLGLAMYKKGNLDESISFYRKALQSDPYLAEAHNDLGVALIDKKMLEEGIYHYQQAIKLKPTHPEAHANLEKAIQGLSQINNRIAEILKKSKNDSINPDYYQQLGFLHYRKGNFDAGMEYYQKALSLDSTNSKSLKGIAAIYAEKNEYVSAISTFKKVLELQPRDPGIYYNIACMYSLQGNRENAIFWLQRAISNGFSNWELMNNDKDLKNIKEMKEFRQLLKQ